MAVKPWLLAKAVTRRGVAWLRFDLPEMLSPSSLPDPPGTRYPTNAERRMAAQGAWELYRATWPAFSQEMRRPAVAPGPYPEEDAASTSATPSTVGINSRNSTEGASASEPEDARSLREEAGEIAALARTRIPAARQVAQDIYLHRMRALKEAAQQFVDGYREGAKQAQEQNIDLVQTLKDGYAQFENFTAEPHTSTKPSDAARK